MMALRTVLAEESQCNLKVWGRFAPNFLFCTKYLEFTKKTDLHKCDPRHVEDEKR